MEFIYSSSGIRAFLTIIEEGVDGLDGFGMQNAPKRYEMHIEILILKPECKQSLARCREDQN